MIAIVAAAAENNVIGKAGKMPWHLPKDLSHFKNLTYGHPVIMGRKTYESLGRPLPGRLNIVVSGNENFRPEGCKTAKSLYEAVLMAQNADETIFIIGGSEIYRQAMAISDRIYLTRIAAEIDVDAFFPEINPSEWKLIDAQFSPADSMNPYDLLFLTYEKMRD
jgi:dihydrofolate reductase